ncbi:hypothetical protein GWO43_06135, partial [candidate division KSB1 bacterium]|nr:hypothetical protein [candidate division KSB1 bacterium]NIR72122.1 hypothetical protein [candidate division KSB1 bacterium]NIS23538.1 hypothetical protein [candidate division KSB1 bacterium]NIT70467.1 hypothetical protein [candidate division KSB1 bacterium]NIU24165.1 hypothetical protein [candidate division KSB1 bacterium]
MAAMPSDQGRVKTTIITLALILIPLAAYYFIYIPHQERYFTNRYLRLLADMSQQIQTKIQHFETIFKNAAKVNPEYLPTPSEERTSRSRTMELEEAVEVSVQKAIELVPNLELIHTDIRIANRSLKETFYGSHFESLKPDSSNSNTIPSNGIQKGDSDEKFIASRLEVELQREGQSNWLHFFVETYVYDPARVWQGYTVYLHAKSSLDKVVRPIVNRKNFDDMLLVNSAGNVMFQRNQKELVASKFDSINTLSGVTLPFNSLLHSSGLYSVHLSGSDYKFFLQPVL